MSEPLTITDAAREAVDLMLSDLKTEAAKLPFDGPDVSEGEAEQWVKDRIAKQIQLAINTATADSEKKFEELLKVTEGLAFVAKETAKEKIVTEYDDRAGTVSQPTMLAILAKQHVQEYANFKSTHNLTQNKD